MNIVKSNLKWKKAPSKRRTTKYIILHCEATPEGKDYTIEQVHSWHLLNGWIGCGYNFVIYRDGTIVEGRPEDCTGSHAVNYNANSIGISYVGGCAKDGKTPKDTRTVELKESLFELCYYLMGKYNLGLENILCHYQITVPKPNMKACPSFKIEIFRHEYLQWVDKNK